MKRLKPAVFLDRDGTINWDEPGNYVKSPEELRIYPFAPAALKKLQDAGYALVVVSNQSGVGRGYFDEDMLDRITDKLTRALARRGVRLAGVYSCLHSPEDRCKCRKPRPTLALQAAKEHGLDLKRSFVVGDKKADIDLARRLKVPGVFLMTGHGRTELERYGRRIRPAHAAKNLAAATRWILEDSR